MQQMTPRATVLIPTKNGGARFGEVLARLVSQRTPWPFEILVIDSGSSDGTLELCRQYPQVRLHTIPPAEFGHGRTRNLGVSLSQAEFIAVITQDALPEHDQWLARMVAALERDPQIAGAFGRHLPYDDANPFVKRDLKLHFDNFARQDPVARLDDRERYDREEGYRQVLHFFSDNNACIRRSVWEQIPYPDVDFAEDQIWAKQIIEAGYAKAYVDDAAVFHSHDFGVIETLRRSFDESAAFRRLFGYRLCPTFRAAVRQSIRSGGADILYLLGHRRQIPGWAGWMVKAPLLNIARQLGFYFGSEWNEHPLFSRLSLDQAKKKYVGPERAGSSESGAAK
ncbi:glycosyltransferase family 2 protein [Cupriavidus respiraculi]|uniref:glycosyltransferase family 2 protein n=1 Tax=Cupriavidus respiraculi TaxID=195930 RepID=UPI001C943B60|nr:glycosyltransferase family A protein [Cupriavidus respiraculi]MBY4949088.1 glycosyltransferase family 2 protein [Cupriavidus respiraculi]